MRRAHPALRPLAAAGIAFAGLVGGHALGYILAVPDPLHRSALISGTGHGYLPSVAWAAAGVGLAALAAGVAAGTSGGRAPAIRRLGAPMAGAQAGAFLVLEVAERLAAGAPLETLSPVLLAVGLAVQVAAGVLGAFVVQGLRRIGSLLRPAPHRRIRLVRSFPLPRPPRAPRRAAARSDVTVRAPPVAVVV